jgi:hypothetical protein
LRRTLEDGSGELGTHQIQPGGHRIDPLRGRERQWSSSTATAASSTPARSRMVARSMPASALRAPRRVAGPSLARLAGTRRRGRNTAFPEISPPEGSCACFRCGVPRKCRSRALESNSNLRDIANAAAIWPETRRTTRTRPSTRPSACPPEEVTPGEHRAADGAYSPRAWLVHQTSITRGAAAHPQVAPALGTSRTRPTGLWPARRRHIQPRCGTRSTCVPCSSPPVTAR